MLTGARNCKEIDLHALLEPDLRFHFALVIQPKICREASACGKQTPPHQKPTAGIHSVASGGGLEEGNQGVQVGLEAPNSLQNFGEGRRLLG